MSTLLDRFNFHQAQWNGAIIICLVFVWACVIGCVISSILSQPFDRRQRVFWIAMVTVLPCLGILAYLPFALRKEDLPMLFHRKPKRAKGKKDDPEKADP